MTWADPKGLPGSDALLLKLLQLSYPRQKRIPTLSTCIRQTLLQISDLGTPICTLYLQGLGLFKKQTNKNPPPIQTISQSQIFWDEQEDPQSKSFSYVSAMPDEASSCLPSIPSHSLDDHKGKKQTNKQKTVHVFIRMVSMQLKKMVSTLCPLSWTAAVAEGV